MDLANREVTIDEKFYAPRTPVGVAAIGDPGEALLVRSVLENLGAAVTLHLIGTPEDFLRVLAQGESAPRYLVICGHGDENGFVFGEFVEDIDISALSNGSMPPAAIAARVNLPGRIVVSTACHTGTKAFAGAFRAGRAAVYVAPDGDPHGADTPLFVHLLFHRILRKGVSPAGAFREVVQLDDEFRIFTMSAF